MSNSNIHIALTQQPPEIWYNQQGGKKECFTVLVELVGMTNEMLDTLTKIPLEVSLLYESGERVHNQSILQLIDIPEFTLAELTATIQIRINDVSKNHQHRRFCLKIDVPDKFQELHQLSIIGCISSTIAVLSKKSGVRKRVVSPGVIRNHGSSLGAYPIDSLVFNLSSYDDNKSKKRGYDAIDSLEKWSTSAYDMLKFIGTQHAFINDDFGRKTLKMWCPVCGANFTEMNRVHLPSCDLFLVLQQFEHHFINQTNHIPFNSSIVQQPQQIVSPVTIVAPQFLHGSPFPQSSIQAPVFGCTPVQIAPIQSNPPIFSTAVPINFSQGIVHTGQQAPQLYSYDSQGILFSHNLQPQLQNHQRSSTSLKPTKINKKSQKQKFSNSMLANRL